MKKYGLILLLAMPFFAASVYAGNIRYGYNPQGEYVPVEIDGKKVEYGYNPQGATIRKASMSRPGLVMIE